MFPPRSSDGSQRTLTKGGAALSMEVRIMGGYETTVHSRLARYCSTTRTPAGRENVTSRCGTPPLTLRLRRITTRR